ncbi:MAG: hypothetical protein AAF367_19790 [Pseudomonadota bacterium]
MKTKRFGDCDNHAHDDYVATCGFDSFETDVLDVARFFFLTFSAPPGHSWIDAFALGEERFGRMMGATMTHSVLHAVQTIRRNRRNPLTFINPCCAVCAKRITQEERYFITTLHSLRRNQRSEAQMFAMMVCEGQGAADLVTSCIGLDRTWAFAVAAAESDGASD